MLQQTVQQLQAIIAAGGDPTVDLPETAAGGNNGNEGGFDAVVLERNAAETHCINNLSILLVLPLQAFCCNQMK